MKKVSIAVILFVSGLLLIFSPFIKNYLIQLKVNNSLNEFTDQSADELKRNRNKENSKEKELIAPPSELDLLKNVRFKGKPVGVIFIPAIDLQLPIYGTMTQENLMFGAAEMNDHQQMGVGNYILAGHHMKQNGLLFQSVPTLENGDMIRITDKTTIYEYKVTSNIIVHETSIEVMESNDKNEITLVTCDEPYYTENRTIVRGELVKETPFKGQEAFFACTSCS
ncbi:class A sortase [Bacillus chungangensis]|uniref:Sortase A n=1 Tax=Bacillus chungangensis TaxID=587633 RepID=A0ABT9WUR9_9BACI|nr:class A sortase [Bacillus chungangensis]MDQ0177036.1 sortase A [Bacillus chungangensis]